jgi:hypothetical protein
MTNAGGKTGLPTWLKIVLITLAVVLIGTVCLIGAGIWLYKSTVKTEAGDIKKTLDSIATFKQPLSDDYQYKMALDADFAGARIGVITHKPDRVTIVLAVQNSGDKILTPQQLVSQIPRGGKFHLEKEGTETVAGKQMTYIAGKTEDASGTQLPVFVGSVNLTQPKNHAVFFVANMDEPGSLDQKVTEGFLQNIESLK